jgi:catechol 2,3-dioxygenase-like lactoylglutathione lyase family enzyme
VSLRSFTHIALRVERLREAEEFYSELFALEVAFREAETPEGWQTLPTRAAWEDAQAAGVELNLVMLYCDGFRLALEGVDRVSPLGQLSHVGVYADESDLERLHARAEGAGCRIVAFDRARSLVIDDLFGVRWELNTFAYDDPPSLSTGARTGLWLDV